MIIPANESHILLIKEIARASWQSTYLDIIGQKQIDYMLDNFYSEKELLQQMKNDHYYYYLAEEKGEICGFAGFEHQYEPGTTKLHRIYFLPHSKKKGMGSQMLQFIVEHCQRHKATSLILNVNKHNSAKEFYIKQGMSIQKEVVLDIGGGYVMDDYIMEQRF